MSTKILKNSHNSSKNDEKPDPDTLNLAPPFESLSHEQFINDLHECYRSETQIRHQLEQGVKSIVYEGKSLELKPMLTSTITQREMVLVELVSRLKHYELLKGSKTFNMFKKRLKQKENLIKKIASKKN